MVEYAAQPQHTYKETNIAGLPLTEELKNALDLAIECARIRRDAYVKQEHLLCGLIAEEVFGRGALQDFNISSDYLEKRLLPPAPSKI